MTDRDIKTLLRDTLSSPGNEILLKELSDRSEEALAHLEESADTVAETTDHEWLARVYSVFAGDEELSVEDKAAEENLARALADDEAAVGRAFREVLIADLPEELTHWANWFSWEVDRDWIDDLERSPAVWESFPVGRQLLEHGLSPLHFLRASDAVAGLILRTCRYDEKPVDFLVRYRSAAKDLAMEPEVVAREALVAEIADMTGCPEAWSESLLFWMLDASTYKPLLFRGLRVEPFSEGISISAHEGSDDLYQRWQSACVVEDATEPEFASGNFEVCLTNLPETLDAVEIFDLVRNGAALPVTGIQYFTGPAGGAVGAGLSVFPARAAAKVADELGHWKVSRRRLVALSNDGEIQRALRGTVTVGGNAKVAKQKKPPTYRALVGNLPPRTKKASVKTLLKDVAQEVTDVRLVASDRGGARFGFVEFKSPDALSSAIKALEGKSIGGRTVFMKRAATSLGSTKKRS